MPVRSLITIAASVFARERRAAHSTHPFGGSLSGDPAPDGCQRGHEDDERDRQEDDHAGLADPDRAVIDPSQASAFACVPITEPMLFACYCVAFVVLPVGVELLARTRGFRLSAVMGLVAVSVVGVLVIGVGLVALAFNGTIQDSGEQPARTLGTAIPMLMTGGLISLIPWAIVLGRRDR
jgi:hypothetical protein